MGVASFFCGPSQSLPIEALGIASAFLVNGLRRDPPDQKAHGGDGDGLGIGLLTVSVGGLQYVSEEGNAEDWFESGLIVHLAIIAWAALITLVWWEMHPQNTHPVVNFHVFRNRTLAAALFLVCRAWLWPLRRRVSLRGRVREYRTVRSVAGVGFDQSATSTWWRIRHHGARKSGEQVDAIQSRRSGCIGECRQRTCRRTRSTADQRPRVTGGPRR